MNKTMLSEMQRVGRGPGTYRKFTWSAAYPNYKERMRAIAQVFERWTIEDITDGLSII